LPLHHIKLWIVCLFAAAAHAQVAASIGGQVLNAATGEPINGAAIVLTEAVASSQPQKFVTETRGLFLFENLPPGRYVLFAECPGFARTAFGSRGNPLAGVTLSLVEAQQMTALVFALTPGSSISGKVLDAAGAAMDGANVLALQPIYQRGKREYIPVASALSDSSGDYKLADLSAGDYLLAASDSTGGAATTFYSGSATLSGAEGITLAAAAAQTGNDIHMVKATGRRVVGGLSGGGKAAIAWLTPKGGATSLILRSAAKIQPGGGFAFSGIAPGAYVLSATEADGITTAAAPIAIAVAQKDLDGLELHAQAGAELNGEVALGANDVPLPAGMQVILETADAPLPRPARAAVDEHGKFTFPKLAPGRYMVHVVAPEALYVRSIRYRSVDVAESGFDFGGGTAAPLLIGLSASAASLGGTVRGADGNVMPGATVALVPTLRRFSRFKEVTTDQFGEFHFDGIAPGEYKLFAWDYLVPGQYQDAAWLKKYEFKGQPVVAKAGGRETLALKAIQ
jgi:Carboxypeptidase regulatory-like domain